MFQFPFIKREVSALKSSNAKIALVTGVPEYLLGYAAFSISKTLNRKVRLISFNSHLDLTNYIENLEKGNFHEGIQIKRGSKFDLYKLAEIGYERVERVWNKGEFSLYGDVAVVWPHGYKELIRISMFDREVEEISLIESESRRKIKVIDSLLIEEVENDEDQDRGGFQITKWVEGVDLETVADIDFAYVKGLTKVEATNLHLPIIDLQLRSIPLVSQVDTSDKVLEEVVRKYMREKYSVVLVDEKRDRYDSWKGFVRNMTDLNKLPKDELELIPKGFIDDFNHQIVLTPYEVFGELDLLDRYQMGIDSDSTVLQEERVERDLLKNNEELFKKIQPGDFVVHEDHGVGKYLGIVERLEGVFIEVGYSGKDKLFIPLTQGKKVTKYIGGKEPRLTTLNSGAWRRLRRKAEEDAEKLATDLIKLYAVRKTIRIPVKRDQVKEEKMEKFVDSFKFQDTEDQAVATEDIVRDLKSDRPMDRLLIGDVGFGKTEVAMRGMYFNYLSGHQAAFLAPTTVLVQQHRAVLIDRFKKFGLKVAALSRFLSSKERREIIEKVKKGEIDIIVGTHSLLSKDVEFKDLGLIVIDEEQKFGVKQKEVLKEKRLQSHVLSMSATPIPRTLNMALSGIRDISSISTAPHGRKSVRNQFVPFDWSKVNEAISSELERNGQVYFVHNRVNSIEDYYKKIKGYFPDHRVEIAHGQMEDKFLEEVMYQFGQREIDILVCTTIIENGIDMPNVNTLVVNRSEIFGLSQLYQLRGRIGRSERQAYAYFMYDKLRGVSGERLDALDEASDLGSGLIIASRDMEIRGVGDILGREQSGAISSVGYGMFINLLHEKILEMGEK